MLNIIANKNVLVKKFETIEEANSYIAAQDMHGDECKFEGCYVSYYEVVADGEQGIFGVEWDNLKTLEEYKNSPAHSSLKAPDVSEEEIEAFWGNK